MFLRTGLHSHLKTQGTYTSQYLYRNDEPVYCLIPDTTAGISDYVNHDTSMRMSKGEWKRTFITCSGLNHAKPAMLMPALPVPCADLMAISVSTHDHVVYAEDLGPTAEYHLFQSK